MTILRAGSAQADITPNWSLTLAGFAVRDHASEGVHRPLRVRAVVLQSESADGERARTVIVSADLLFWAAEYVDLFKDDISAIADVSPSQILLSATHTHSGPQTSAELSSSIGVLDPRFHDRLRDGVRRVVSAAIDQLEPVTMTRWVGEHDLGFNRRPQFNPAGSIDRTLTVLRLDRDDGSASTMLVHYTCHPTIYQGYQLSGEYCGVAMSELEDRFSATCLFLQGCCGDINPDINRDGIQARGGLDVIDREGLALADAVSDLVSDHGEELEIISLKSVQQSIDLPYDALPDLADLRLLAETKGYMGEWSRWLLGHPERMEPSIALQMQRHDLAAGCSLVAMNGEVCVDYGLFIRAMSGGTTLLLGYANGMTGYIPTAAIIAEGGYEAGDSIPYFYLPAPFAPEVEAILKQGLTDLIGHPTGVEKA